MQLHDIKKAELLTKFRLMIRMECASALYWRSPSKWMSCQFSFIVSTI